MKRSLRILTLVLITVLAIAGALYGFLRASLPQLDGERALAGLQAPVTILRDEGGMPTLKGESRLDVARATGFVHAQDRFFQMDLLRRSAAGELAALVGAAAVPLDEKVRLHGLRGVATQVIAREPQARRQLLQAYAEGVNAGLAALKVRPIEYGLLRAKPQPWTPEDTVLVIYAMYLDLQDETGEREARLAAMGEVLPAPLYRFLTAHAGHWDAPLDASASESVPLPGPEVYDLRRLQLPPQPPTMALDESASDDRMIGSNNWAIGAGVSADGEAWLADDMHLGLRMPNVWYRARLEWRQDGAPRSMTGLTLPGAPAVVVGSNGRVAWGFTNSYGDFTDLIELELHPDDSNRYRTPAGYRAFEERIETIAVKGGEPVKLTVRETVWGPVVGEGKRLRALRWSAHDPAATNLGLLELEQADSLPAAFAVARRTGVPAQNFLAVDTDANIGWTIIGRIPVRRGFDGQLPVSWAEDRGWDGWLAPVAYPEAVNPAGGRLWTANNRVVGGVDLARLGDGGYALGARARQIRDDLYALDAAQPEDVLAIALDDRALFLSRWRELLLRVLDEQALADDPRRAALRQAVEDWGGRAAVDSVGYRMVRAFRLFLHERVFNALTAEVRAEYPDFRFVEMPQAEAALWRLVSERPPHLLDPRHESWEQQLLATANELLARFWQPDSGLAEASWGKLNVLRMGHPLTQALPQLAPWLDMPAVPLPGDSHMPRVQAPTHGASQRMVVSPGREGESILHLPGGQSGHPLSPYYRRGHDDWVQGRPTPFLPGAPEHTLVLRPAS
jgi:penicillin amidase